MLDLEVIVLGISKTKYRFHNKMLIAAGIISELSDFERNKFGAILCFNKTIISSGYNQKKTHPLQYELNKSRYWYKHENSFVHAEMSCLSKIKKVPKNSILYVARKNKNNEFLMARPCSACMQKIITSGIEMIIYTTDSNFAIEYLKQ